MKIDIPDIVKNSGISFVGNLLILNVMYYYGKLMFWTVAILMLINAVGAYGLEKYQAKKNYKTKQEQLEYLNEHGWKDIVARMAGFVVAVVLALMFIGV